MTMGNTTWTDVRKRTLTDYYNLPEEAQQRADDLFVRMDALAAECADQGQFEQQLLTTGLSEEYNQLVASCSAYAKVLIDGEEKTKDEIIADQRKNTAKTAAEEAAKSQARQQVSAAITQVLPDEVNRVRLYGLRGLPIIGDIIRRAEQIDSLRWMFGFRKKGEE